MDSKYLLFPLNALRFKYTSLRLGCYAVDIAYA